MNPKGNHPEFYHLTSDLLFEVDLSGNIIKGNKAFLNFFGIKKKSKLSLSLEDLLHTQDHHRVIPHHKNQKKSLELPGITLLNFKKEAQTFNLKWKKTDSHFLLVLSPADYRQQFKLNIQNTQERLKKQNKALSTINKKVSLHTTDFKKALQTLTETSSKVLGVERSSIWLYNNDKSAIYCADLFEQTDKKHSNEMVLLAKNYPNYFTALKQDLTIAATDANTDKRTKEFSKNYLKPLGICSLLDSPIRISGKIVGIICNEHLKEKREWTLDEQNFVASMANIASLIIENKHVIETRSRAEKSEEMLSMVVNKLPVVLFTVNHKNIITSLNGAGLKSLGFNNQQAIGLCITDFYQFKKNSTVLKKAQVNTIHLNMEPAGISIPSIWEVFTQPIPDENKQTGFVALATNITEKKKIEEELRQSHTDLEKRVLERTKQLMETNALLKKQKDERETLLKEIHHRVKNNLQIVNSLLRLQAMHITDESIRNMFEDIQNRVISMSLLHEIMYKSENFSHIDLKKYITALTGELMKAFSFGKKIDVEINVEPFRIGMRSLLPAGLILTELITNSMKHGFKDKKKGKLLIELKTKNQQFELHFSDDGVGMPKHLFEKSNSLGIELIKTFVEQLNGKIQLIKGHGTQFRIVMDLMD